MLLLNANALHAEHLEAALHRMKAHGYRFIPLATALADSAYRSRNSYVGPAGLSWLERWSLTRGITPPAEPREDPYIAELAQIP